MDSRQKEHVEDDEEDAGFDVDNWASVVDPRGEEEKSREREAGGENKKKKKEKVRSYFSDESGEDE